MLLARPDTKPAQIGLSPLIDVVFLLLIFFVVTTSFSKPQIPLTLPDAEGSASMEQSPLVVSIDATGRAAIEGRTATPDEIGLRLRDAPPDAIVIRADTDARHGAVVRVLDVVARAGIADVAIAVGGGREPSDVTPDAVEARE